MEAIETAGSSVSARLLTFLQVLAGRRRVMHGEPVNMRWTARMCLPCRQEIYQYYDEPIPANINIDQYISADEIQTMGFRLTQSELDSLPTQESPPGYHRNIVYSLKEVYKFYHQKVGGNAGVAISSTDKTFLWKEKEEQKRTEARIDDYCHM